MYTWNVRRRGPVWGLGDSYPTRRRILERVGGGVVDPPPLGSGRGEEPDRGKPLGFTPAPGPTPDDTAVSDGTRLVLTSRGADRKWDNGRGHGHRQ